MLLFGGLLVAGMVGHTRPEQKGQRAATQVKYEGGEERKERKGSEGRKDGVGVDGCRVKRAREREEESRSHSPTST
jgi:hypothetical protein